MGPRSATQEAVPLETCDGRVGRLSSSLVLASTDANSSDKEIEFERRDRIELLALGINSVSNFASRRLFWGLQVEVARNLNLLPALKSRWIREIRAARRYRLDRANLVSSSRVSSRFQRLVHSSHARGFGLSRLQA